MKFMLMMNHPGKVAYKITSWAQDDIKAHIAFMKNLNVSLRKNGELVGAEGLAGPDQAKLVRASSEGEPMTDGVFPESKEFLAGYWLVDVENAERAYRIAAQASLAPGSGGRPLYLNIEVRQVMSAPLDE